jgi:hypothetical protein
MLTLVQTRPLKENALWSSRKGKHPNASIVLTGTTTKAKKGDEVKNLGCLLIQ